MVMSSGNRRHCSHASKHNSGAYRVARRGNKLAAIRRVRCWSPALLSEAPTSLQALFKRRRFTLEKGKRFAREVQ